MVFQMLPGKGWFFRKGGKSRTFIPVMQTLLENKSDSFRV